MDTLSTRVRLGLDRHAPAIALAVVVLGLLWAAYQGLLWTRAYQLNRAYRDGSLAGNLAQRQVTPAEAYAIGYLLNSRGREREAAKYFMLAEASEDPALRARAKLALGNLYFDIALKAADIQTGLGHIHGVAQIEIARESYKGALRIDPQLYAARFNLELLDRLSPPKRIEGWERETDGVTLVPQKRDGWASMKDNTRRGLP